MPDSTPPPAIQLVEFEPRWRAIDDEVTARPDKPVADILSEIHARARPPRLKDTRPTIQYGAEVEQDVTAAIAALRSDPQIYQRDGSLTRVLRVTADDPDAQYLAVGTPKIQTIAAPTLQERLSTVAIFEGYDGRSETWKRKKPPTHIVSATLARGEYPGIRTITGITEAPTMRPDGSIIDQPGWDRATGIVYLPQRAYPSVGAHLTIDDARRALRMLEEPWRDFPATTEAGKAVPLAAVLTLIARPAISGAVPAGFFDASTRGSGKTIQVRCIGIIVHGREPALTTFPDDDIELEKKLGAFALRGAALIALDNIVKMFGGGALDKALTATDRISIRVLGQSEEPELLWRAMILATGNNAVIGRDTARRTLIQRLEPGIENPESRDINQYRIPHLEQWCHNRHPQLVAAALTLLSAYVQAGRPSQSLPSWGSFQPWSDLVANAIVWAGGPNVLDARATVAAEEDDATAALRTLLPLWRSFAADGCSARHAIEALWSPAFMRGDAPPDGWHALRAAIETIAPPKRTGYPPDAGRLGCALRAAKGAVYDGLQIASTKNRTGTAEWYVREVGR